MNSGEKAEWVQACAAVVGAVATIVGLWFVVSQINFAKEQYLAYKAERNTERMEKFYTEWTSPTMLFYRANAAADHPNGSAYLIEIFSFFERLSIAKNKGIVTIEDMNDYFQDSMLGYWCGFEDFVKKNRDQAGGDPTLWSEFEKSVNQVKKLKNVRCLTQPELENFMAVEKQRYVSLRAEPGPTVLKK